MKLGATTPILRMFDEAKTREFYVDFLGFTIDWEHRFDDHAPLYMQVSRDGCVLNLSEHYGDCCPGAGVRIAVEDLGAYQAELIAKQFKYARPGIETMPWGSREMTIQDPSFNRLCFNEPLPESDTE